MISVKVVNEMELKSLVLVAGENTLNNIQLEDRTVSIYFWFAAKGSSQKEAINAKHFFKYANKYKS